MNTDNTQTPGKSKPKEKMCQFCRREIFYKKDSFSCFMCNKWTHIACTEFRDTQDTTKLKNKAGSFLFICIKCKTDYPSTSLSAKHFDATTSAKELELKHKKEMQDLTALYQDNYNKVTEELNNHKTALVNTNRQLELAQLAAKQQQKWKRTRFETETEDEGLNLHGFPNIEEILTKQTGFFMKMFQKLESKQTEMLGTIDKLSIAFRNVMLTTNQIVPPLNLNVISPRPPVAATQSRIQTPRPLTNTGNLQIPRRIAAKRGNISYAQALTSAIIPPNGIRNISIMGNDPENSAKIVAQIRKDDACKESTIQSIKRKGQFNLTIKCANENEATLLEDTLSRKYRETIKITQVQPTSP